MSDLDSPHPPHYPVLLNLEQFLPYRLSVLSNRISSNIAKVYGNRYGIWRFPSGG